MIGQDNETFQERVSRKVTEAVIEAGRAHPGAADVNLDVNVALAGMCDAMASFATAIALEATPGDREQAAKTLGTFEEEIVARLRFFADAIRAGTYPPPERPKPRLVE